MAQKYPKHGVLNDVTLPHFEDRLDLQDHDAISAFKSISTKHFTQDSLKNSGPYKAVVLRVEKSEEPKAGSWLSSAFSGLFGGSDKIPGRFT